ncbi:MAG TPA: adenine phosphoribosyltransferase [Ktedonobacterales bacterium]|nr:adenine phosphoribosyltransferase [Ktedonobacterales bacterium]
MTQPMPTIPATPDQTVAPTAEQTAWLKGLIRNVPDFPQPGILFRDITPLLRDAAALRFVIDTLANRYRGAGLDQIVGIESRGFIFGAPLAYALGVGFTLVRKQGKLPAEVMSVEYSLEYGTNILEIHKDAFQLGQRALIVDDLLATGGTTAATMQLVTALGAQVAGLAFIVELAALGGRAHLAGPDIFSLLTY